MKKAKIMLSAIAVLAIVSGTLAFKAKTMKFGVVTVFSCNTLDRLCNIPLTEDVTLTSITNPNATIYSSVATTNTVPCVTTCPLTTAVLTEF